MSNLVSHARRELQIFGEEPDTIDWYCRVVAEFASFGHSGGSAWATIPVLHDLLQYRNLTPLTDDPDEWHNVSELFPGGSGMWQNRRNSEAFSEDGGLAYYLLSERDAAGSIEATPLHRSEPRRTSSGDPS
jgi:hypothetical protein